MKDDKVTTHPSYGVARFSRVSCSHAHPLFGSSIRHSNTIVLEISHAEHVRSEITGDHYYDRKEIVQVEMSGAQFAEMMTTMNYGSGVPVTIRRIQGEKIEDCHTVDKRSEHSQEFKKQMRDFAQKLKADQAKLLEYLKKDKLSKDDKRTMQFMFEYLTQEINSNIPFFEERFEEQMDKTIVEAKAEMESFVSNTVTKFGLEAIHNQNVLNASNEAVTETKIIE
jgi:hypothetical protein